MMRAPGIYGLALAVMTIGWSACAEAADLSGIWRLDQASDVLRTDAGEVPPLLPAASELYQMRIAASHHGDASWDPAQDCKPLGVPRVSMQQGWPFEVMQSAKRIDFLYQWDRLDRAVLMADRFPGGAGGPDGDGPYYLGNSIGHWDGDTLVVSLRQQDGSTMLDPSGLPHSDAMTLQERWTLIDGGKRLQDKLHVVDPATYRAPWDATLVFVRAPTGTRIKQDNCADRHPGLFATIDNAGVR